MRSLGISVYPNQAAVEDILAYIMQAAKYGYKRIFTSFLLEENKSVEQIIAKFKRITEEAKKCEMTIIADVEPDLFNKFNVSYRNLTFFDDLGLDGIRLAEGLSGAEEAEMSFNPYGLKVELDASLDTKYLDNVFYKRYAGELQIALKSMKNGGKTNVVAKIVPEEVFLLDYLEPWMEFKFVEKK